MRTITFLQMKYFDSIVKNKSITKAAEELFVSQPAISKALIELEKEYNLKFFLRKNNQLLITEEGFYFWEKIRKVLHDMEELSTEMKYFGKKKTLLTIGITPMIGAFLFPSIFSKFHRKFPNTQINIFEYGSFQVFEAVKNNDINLGFLIDGKDNSIFTDSKIESYLLKESKLVFCVGKNHKYATKKKISLEEIKNIPLVLLKNNSYQNFKINEFFKQKGIEPNIELTTNQLSAVTYLLQEGNTGSFFIKEYAETNKDILQLELEEEIEIKFLLIWKKDNSINQVITDFISVLKEKN